MTLDQASATAPATSQRLEWANALRGVAALTVAVWHLGMAFFVFPDVAAIITNYPDPAAVGPWEPAQTLSASGVDLGAFGITLFFMISGLVISRSLRHYTRFAFFVARCLRLLPTYAVGYLVICLTVAIVQWRTAGTVTLQADTVLWGIIPGLGLLLSRPVVPIGIDWTLIVEISFYAICLVIYRPLVQRRWVPVATVAGIVVAEEFFIRTSAFVDTPAHGVYAVATLVLPFLPLLLIGVVVAQPTPWRSWSGALSILAIFGAYLWMSRYTSPLSNFASYRITVGVTVIVFLLVATFGGGWRKHRFTTFLADISYPLYVVHLVVGFAVMFPLAKAGWPPLVLLAMGLMTTVALAWAIHVLVELPTHRVGSRIARQLSSQLAAAPTGSDPNRAR